MSKRKRLTRTERARRQRIAAALKQFYRKKREQRERRSRAAKKYWRSLKRVEKRFSIPRNEAREVKRIAKREDITLEAARDRLPPERPPSEPTPAPPEPAPPAERIEGAPEWEGGLFAFNLANVEPGMPERLPRNHSVTATIDYYAPDADEPFAHHGVTFDSGSTNEEFFHNYYKAVRDDYKELLQVQTLTSEGVVAYVTELDSQGRVADFPG